METDIDIVRNLTPVYTYDNSVHNDPEKKESIFQFYVYSIKSAIEVGYSPIIYTNSNRFNDFPISVIKVDKSFLLWDAYKFVALEEINNNCFLVDGDVFFHKKIEFNSKIDVYFDAWEYSNWAVLYNDGIKKLSEMGIQNTIPEWSYTKQQVMSCGILKIYNKEFKEIYLDRWKNFHKFIENNKDEFADSKFTAIGAQYLLTILCNYYKVTKHNFSTKLRSPNNFYTHYAGKIKFRGGVPLVKKSRI